MGYVANVPAANLKEYKVVKQWGTGTPPVDPVVVELYLWNPDGIQNQQTAEQGLTRRSGVLIDRQKLNDDNNWSYTWKNIRKRITRLFLSPSTSPTKC